MRSLSLTQAVVITHPHPLYGGDMDNLVVGAIVKAYQKMGWTTLRFNFRGTGRSQGTFDDGKDEQKDVQAAIDYLKNHGFEQIELAGYSFGAWVLANWTRNDPTGTYRMRLVAPPVAFVEFKDGAPINGLCQVIVGELDDLAPPNQVGRMLKRWQKNALLHVIPKADHSLYGHIDELERFLTDAIGNNPKNI